MNARLSKSTFHILILLSLLTALVGFQQATPTLAADVTITPTETPTAADNDYTRINDAIQAAGAGDTIKLLGTFDWTEGCIAVTNAEIDEIWRAIPMGAMIQIKP